ncbi:MAG: dephospho-CoA kinase [Bacteroidetes bacterium]|jgi:dephospho-CoA kinase|nr:dephospho-CoA kinase [Bacteroidota bacterium]
MNIGLTGGIGSGKSTVAKLLETMGCAIYNSDERAKALYFNTAIKLEIIKLLGKESYLNETEINRKYISEKVFSDSDLLLQLNQIIHPAVKNDFAQFAHKVRPGTLIIKESALLFETGIYRELDRNIVVTASTETKIARVMKRNSMSKEEIEKRMLSQLTDEQKIPLANYVISNDKDSALIPQVLSIIETLKKDA